MATKRNYEEPMSLAEALRERMRADELSQVDVAALLDVSQTQVGRWLAGHLPSPPNRAKVRSFLKVSEADFAVMLFREPEPSVPEQLREIRERLSALEDLIRKRAPRTAR